MQVDTIQLSGFRNYNLVQVDFDPGINVIAGENAQGKTNLLEAIYLLTVGHGFRTRFDRELIGFEQDQCEIKAKIHAGGREQQLRFLLRKGQRKQIWRNGVREKAVELSGNLTAVLFCPDDLYLLRDGAGARRRMLDMAICQLRPGYQTLIREYNHVYENKTRILRDWQEKPSLLDNLEEYDVLLCRLGARILRYRSTFSRRLNEAASLVHKDFSGGREILQLSYITVKTITDPTAPVEILVDQLWEHLLSHREAELASGLCLSGIHKDDLIITINGREAKRFASQGQTRTAALSIKLAEREIHLAETGEYPILLLDDVLSELDESRQNYVLNRIGGGQTFITCCEDRSLAQRTGGRVLMIQKGEITPCTCT